MVITIKYGQKSPLSGTVDSWIFWVERHSVEIPGGEIHVTTAPRSLGEVIWGWTRDEILDCGSVRRIHVFYHVTSYQYTIYTISFSRILYNMPYDHHALYNITMSVIKIPHVVARHQSFATSSPGRSSILRKQQSTAPAPNSTAPGCVLFLDDKAARIQ